jgi:hypothetical protein
LAVLAAGLVAAALIVGILLRAKVRAEWAKIP